MARVRTHVPGRPRNGPSGTGSGRPGTPVSLAAQVTLTIPWETSQGGSAPGEAAGFGLLDPGTARDLLAAAARHRDTRWCYTALHPDGTDPAPRPPATTGSAERS